MNRPLKRYHIVSKDSGTRSIEGHELIYSDDVVCINKIDADGTKEIIAVIPYRAKCIVYEIQ